MKKILSTLLLLLALVGCTSSKTLNNETFAEKATKATITDVKIDLITSEKEYEERLTEEDTELRTAIVEAIASFELTESENQNKIFGTPVFFAELYKPYDENYVRFSLYQVEDAVYAVLQSQEEYKKYDFNVESEDATTMKDLGNQIINHYSK